MCLHVPKAPHRPRVPASARLLALRNWPPPLMGKTDHYSWWNYMRILYMCTAVSTLNRLSPWRKGNSQGTKDDYSSHGTREGKRDGESRIRGARSGASGSDDCGLVR